MRDPKHHWEKIYAEKSPEDVSWHQQSPELSLELIKNTGISLNDAIIDVGGGASTLVDNLHKNAYKNLSVLDISENALQHARDRLGKNASAIHWYTDNILNFEPVETFTLWHDRAVFHFLTDAADRKKYVSTLTRALSEHGHLIIAAFSLSGPTMCSGLEIVQYDAEKIGNELGHNFTLQEQCSENHITPSKQQQQFNYFRFSRN